MLLNDDLTTVEDIHTTLGWTLLQLHTVDAVPLAVGILSTGEVDGCRLVGTADDGIGLVGHHLAGRSYDFAVTLDGEPDTIGGIASDAQIESCSAFFVER